MKLNSIDLSLSERLKDREFRREWFRAELESSVPELFRELREARGLTQVDLAGLTEMKQSAISRFEASTDAVWKIETLLRIADALDAQLSISLEPSESVIQRYASDRIGGGGGPPRSVIEAAAQHEGRKPQARRSPSIVDWDWFEKQPQYSHQPERTIRGQRPWN